PKPPSEFARLPAGIGKAVESHRFSPSLDTESTEQPGRLAVYTTNMATPAANIATVVRPTLSLQYQCFSPKTGLVGSRRTSEPAVGCSFGPWSPTRAVRGEGDRIQNLLSWLA